MHITAIGLDLAKHWFPIHGVNAAGTVVRRRTGVDAARNCARGCTFSASTGRRPIQIPAGTQTWVASAMTRTTRGE
jgi:hypothetical protein